MLDIDYEVKEGQVIAIIKVDNGFVVDNGRTELGKEINYHIYTVTPGETPLQPIKKSTPFHVDNNYGKPLELQLIEGRTGRKRVKKTRENVSSAK